MEKEKRSGMSQCMLCKCFYEGHTDSDGFCPSCSAFSDAEKQTRMGARVDQARQKALEEMCQTCYGTGVGLNGEPNGCTACGGTGKIS